MNFMAGGIFLCTKFSPGKKHYSVKAPRHFEGSREISCTQKFPIELKRSGFTSDRKPFVKSFLLKRQAAASRWTGNYIIYTLSPVGQSTTLSGRAAVAS